MMSLFYTFMCLFSLCVSQSQEKQKLCIYALSAVSPGYYGGYVVGAQRLAADSINNRSDLLQNYEISINVLDSEGSKTKALDIALRTSSEANLLADDNSTIQIPIILGAPFSSLSIITSPALAAFNWGQISSAATSVLLSDIASYPTFYRTIASDGLQSEGIILLCQQFNWTSIGVLYVNDNFGIYLTNGILELGVKRNIKANAVAYFRYDPASYLNAAKTLKQIGVFITVIIAHAGELSSVFSALDKYSLTGFPYFYLGVDSWLDKARIVKHKIEKYTVGYIGTVPWQPSTLARPAYAINGLGEVYDVATSLHTEIENAWDYEFSVNPNFSTNLSEMNSKSIYGWDSLYTLANVLEIFDKKYNIKENILKMNSSFIINELHDIITNHVQFLSVTGNVSFEDNGDRANGLYAFGNVINEEGKVDYFGYFTDKFVEVQFDKIVWPKDFSDKGIIPRSEKLVKIKIESINQGVYITVIILCGISLLFVGLSIVVTYMYRNSNIVRAASWRLNILTCIGCSFAYCTLIVYGLTPDDVICSFREWLAIISFTLVFMPLFSKTYRIAVIFTGMLQLRQVFVTDTKLVSLVLVCLLIDVIILTIFTLVEPDKMNYINSRTEEIHALADEQYVYLACTKETYDINIVFYGVMGLWKLLELVFGIYIVLTVSRMGLKHMTKFNETKDQFTAIIFTLVMMGLAVIPLMSNGDDENTFYIVISIVTLSISNVVWSVNLLPRLIATYQRKEKKYELGETELVRRLVKKQIKMRSQQSRATLFKVSSYDPVLSTSPDFHE